MSVRVVDGLPTRTQTWIREMLAKANMLRSPSKWVEGKAFDRVPTADITATRLRSRFPDYEFAARSGVIYCRRKPGAK